MEELPRGWTEVAIGDVAELQLGKMLDKARNVRGRAYPYLRNINVRWFSFDTSDLLEMRFEDDEAEKFSIADGDVLVCEGGEPGRAAVWRGGRTHLKYQKALHRVRPCAALLPDWIVLFLKHAADAATLQDHFTGTTIKHLPAQALATVKMPLPPLAEQRRIVARIEALFARTRRARAELGRSTALLIKHKGVVLTATAKAESTSTDWPMVRLGDLVTSSLYGPRFAATDYISDGVPTIRTTDMTPSGEIFLRDPPRIRVSTPDLERWRLLPGDLIITRTGSIGRCAVVPDDLGNALPSAYLIRLRLDRARVLPRYVLAQLLSPEGQEAMQAGATAVTQSNVNARALSDISFPLPPLDEQERLLASMDRTLRANTSTMDEVAAGLRLSDRLDAAILARAFRGELVPQDPADEPARLPPAAIARPRRRAVPLHEPNPVPRRPTCRSLHTPSNE